MPVSFSRLRGQRVFPLGGTERGEEMLVQMSRRVICVYEHLNLIFILLR